MNFVLFYHSLVSDWNHGNAHFLRGIVAELLARGHSVKVYEPRDAWSVENLVRDHGEKPIDEFLERFPHLKPVRYDLATLDLDQVLDGADVVIVHEWNEEDLVRRVGEHRARTRTYRLFFHDTHHRAATEPEEMSAYALDHYDGVLAYGRIIRDLYLERGWARDAWTWHEAADTRTFYPRRQESAEGDLVWIGNWGDDEREAELNEFLIDPVRDLGLRASVYGVRYPEEAVEALVAAEIDYGGWLPNWKVPEVFSRFRMTVHIPRRPYVTTLRGIPTIRPFEAMACGIPLISAPWEDAEDLFQAGADYLVARNGEEMKSRMRAVLNDASLAQALGEHGLQTIRRRHTCAHRVDELLEIIDELTPVGQTATSEQRVTTS